jgi:ABC-type branched-subunit amino acid transport system permease subunit
MRLVERTTSALLLLLALAFPFLAEGYVVFQATMVLSYAVALLGLNILTGYNGQISLGHGAFYALGAYTAAILMDRFGLPYWATIPAAGAVCLVAGVLFGLPALKLEGLYLALATFALGVAMPQLLKYKHLEPWTGGVQGLVLAKPDAPFGLPLTPDQWLYLFALAVAVILFALARNLLHSGAGRAIVAVRDHPLAAQAMGIDNRRYKAGAFGISAMFTGIGGALSAIAVQFVAPDHDVPVDLAAGGRGGRRRRNALGCAVWRPVHRVRSDRGREDHPGRAVGDLRRGADPVRVLDAGRCGAAAAPARMTRPRRTAAEPAIKSQSARCGH